MVGTLSPVLTKRHPSAHRSLWLWSLPLGARSPGQGRVVKQRHSLHAEQDRQAPGHHVVQHDRTGGSRRTFVIFKDTKPHPSHMATWRWDSYRHEMNSTGSTSHLKEQEALLTGGKSQQYHILQPVGWEASPPSPHLQKDPLHPLLLLRKAL